MAEFSKVRSESRYDQLDEECFVCEKIINVITLSDIEGKCFSLYSKNFRRDCENSMICIQRNVLTDRNFFWEKNYYVAFLGPWQNSLVFCRKVSRRGCENCMFCPHTIIFMENPFCGKRNFSFSLGILNETFLAF